MKSRVLDVSSGQVRTIRLYGRLGAKFGRVHRLAVKSAAEAVRALSSQLAGFENYLMTSKDRGEGYAVFYGKENLDKEQLRAPAGSEDIRIAPIMMGNKKAGWVSVIVGIILVIVGTVLSPFTGGASLVLVPMGYSMIIGGVIQLLMPTPKGQSSQDRPENKPGHAFNGPLNTQAQGAPVGLLYGELIIGSAVISAGINAVDNGYIPGDPGFGYGGGGGGGAAPWHNYNNLGGGID